MREFHLLQRIALAFLVLVAAPALAENTLQGLEMDVMEPGESAAPATSRIVLPPPLAAPEHDAGIDPEQGVRIGVAGEASMDNMMDGVAGDPAVGGRLEPEEEDPGAIAAHDRVAGDAILIGRPSERKERDPAATHRVGVQDRVV